VTLTFDPVTLIFDLKHLQRIACDEMKICTKFERNRTIRGRVIAITVFNLNDIEHDLSVALGSGIISPSLTFDNLFVPEL